MRLSWRKLFVLGALLVSAPGLSAGCRDVVAGDALVGVDELCAILRDCYGDRADIPRCDTMKNELDSADATVTAEFLEALDPACLEACSRALGCTDVAPLCVSDTEADGCVGRASCCDWTTGRTDCVDGSCCRADGQPCASGADCCNDNCRNEYCGGAACKNVDEVCSSPFQCCTRRCVEDSDQVKRCAPLGACADTGDPCLDDKECCAGPDGAEATCEGAAAGVGLCTPAEQQQQQCLAGSGCDPQGSCCAAGLTCWPLLEGGVCGPATCAPVDVDCEIDADCCAESPDAQGVCNHVPQPHCEIAPACVDDPVTCVCVNSGVVRADGEQCCSGVEEGGTMGLGPVTCLEFSAQPCAGLESLECHSPCFEGERLSATSCDTSTDPGWDACVAVVIAADSFCACTEWDSICVARAISDCSALCS